MARRRRVACCDFVGLQGRGDDPGGQASVRRPAAAGDRAGAGQQAAAAAARRTHRRHEPHRDRRDDRLHPPAARRPRDHDPADRARDARRDGHLREDHGPGLRREDRRGHAPRDPAEPARDRGVPRTRRRRGRKPPARPTIRPTSWQAPDGHRGPVEVDDVHTYYGNIHALKGVSLDRGAGRDRRRSSVPTVPARARPSTTISGLVRPRNGDVRLDGEDLGASTPHRDRGQGRGPGAGRPAHLRPPHGDREPADGRLSS